MIRKLKYFRSHSVTNILIFVELSRQPFTNIVLSFAASLNTAVHPWDLHVPVKNNIYRLDTQWISESDLVAVSLVDLNCWLTLCLVARSDSRMNTSS